MNYRNGRKSGARQLERVKGIEPSYAAWEAAVLPLNYTRVLTWDNASALILAVEFRVMIQVTVNGAAHRFERPVNVRELLETLSMAGKKVAVERNGEIVPKGAHQEVLVQNGDRLEIVVAVGGG
jgi:sulfur carrier protein